jgi:hypothetical protein
MITDGWEQGGLNYKLIQGVLNTGFTAFVIGSVIIILAQAITRWVNHRRIPPRETAHIAP